MKLFISSLFYLYIGTFSLSVLAQRADKTENTSRFFPMDQLYPHYLANPLRSTFSFQTLFFNKSTIANTGKERFDLKLGGRLGMYRHTSADRQWQLTLEGGFHGQFDTEQSEDNVGWDGLYGISFDVRENNNLAWRVGLHHTSSHIGDEIIERTGRARINYTRQEVRAGLAWFHSSHLQSYIEAGKTYDINNKVLQRPLRYEAGIQYENLGKVFHGLGLYSAIDLSTYQESDWDINTTFQLGFIYARDERRWRFGLEYYDGRSQLGEFFQDRESYLGIGLWIDI